MRVDEEHKKQGNTRQPRQGKAARRSEVQGTQELIRPLLSSTLYNFEIRKGHGQRSL
jgi:hypothetical protein